MTKDENKRTVLITKLADHLLAHGLIGSSLRPLARAAGTSDRMLLYYFRDQEDLLAATSQHIAAQLTMMLAQRQAPALLDEDALVAHLISVLGEDAYWPYMRLWLEMASRAAGGDVFFKTIGSQIGRGFFLWVGSQLAEQDTQVKASQAARVMRATEGWLFLKSIGLDDINALALKKH